MPEYEQRESSQRNFEVEEITARNGTIYYVFFPTVEAAEKAIRDFWDTREGGMMAKNGLKSGMLNPIEHTITSGDRTESHVIQEQSIKDKHPGMLIGVSFNGNTEALSPKGVEALRKLGYIK